MEDPQPVLTGSNAGEFVGNLGAGCYFVLNVLGRSAAFESAEERTGIPPEKDAEE